MPPDHGRGAASKRRGPISLSGSPFSPVRSGARRAPTSRVALRNRADHAQACRRDSRNQGALIILQNAQRKIAATPQQASHHTGQMAMIDAKPFLRAPPTDRTGAVLLFQQRVVFGGRYAVLTYVVMSAIALTDLILVRLVVGAIPRV